MILVKRIQLDLVDHDGNSGTIDFSCDTFTEASLMAAARGLLYLLGQDAKVIFADRINNDVQHHQI